jgi:hypothetical protein
MLLFERHIAILATTAPRDCTLVCRPTALLVDI